MIFHLKEKFQSKNAWGSPKSSKMYVLLDISGCTILTGIHPVPVVLIQSGQKCKHKEAMFGYRYTI